MVVATQKSRQRLGASDDSLARSLHKDVDYPAINVSRRSPDHQSDTPLAPDSRYPTSNGGPVSGHRKRQNTLPDTGWHTCFKNNNYVFLRNGSATRPDRQYCDKVKDTNSDVTFVITTTAPEKDEHEEKLIVSLDESKPKIKRVVAPIASAECSDAENTPNGTAKATPDARQDNSSGKRHKKSDKKEKKSSNWLKKLTPGKSKLKFDATAEERAPIYECSPEESPESCENIPPKSGREIKTIRISPRPESETPVKVLDLIGEGPHKGPHTSTPKPLPDTDRFYKSLPRGGPTPHRPYDGRYSVRRRLPYDEISLSRDESLFQVSPLSATKIPLRKNLEMSLDLSPLERRASCHRKIIESPKFQSRLHPTESVSDIPYADSANEVSFDERPKPKINRANSSDFLENVSFDDKPRPRVSRMNKIDIDDVFFNEPPRRKITRANTIVARSTHRERYFSDPTSEQMLGSLPEMSSYRELPVDVRPISSSEPSLRVKRAQSCRAIQKSTSPMKEEKNKSLRSSRVVQKAASPMEEEENRSLDWHAKQLRSPDDSTVTFSPYIPKKTPPRENPVTTWLKELRLLTESECLNALQAKEIIKEDWITNALAVGNAQETAERVWETGSTATKHIEEMVESLKKPKLSSTPFSLKVAQFCSSVVDLLKMGTVAEQQITQVEARIKKSCSDLLDAIQRDEDIEEWKNKMIAELQVVQESVKAIVKHLLLKPVQVIVECSEKATNINSMKRAVFALILLGRLHSTFCELAVRLGAVRSLLSIIVESKWKDMHPCALRALTVLSCIPTAIKSFEEGGGVDCVCDVLCDESTPEGARSEAAGLVAQITAPWTEGNGYVLHSINQNAERLVRSIAGLASKTESSEVFLLSSAALANLSFAEEVLKKMKENRVLEILVEACRNSPHAASLFIKDQVATVLANMAAKEQYRSELSSGGSLVLLLCFLQLRPSVGHGPPQLAACERIQQKAAIALARLCTNPETSNIVADMQGIQRLVKLCKDRKERNDSDSVLVACLAALRKIAAVRQKEEFKKLGAQELVEPRLWDAFIAHSSKRESYV